MCLNHPQTIPQPRLVEKLSSMKRAPSLGALRIVLHSVSTGPWCWLPPAPPLLPALIL